MMLLSYLTFFATLAVNVIGAWNDFNNLHPVLDPIYDTAELANIDPSTKVSLDYGLDNTMDPRSRIVIDMHANHPAVLLEAIGAVVNVSCTYNTVTIVFGTKAAFNRALLQWPRYDDRLYLITNHLENCDAKGERGLYRTTALIWYDDSLAVTARTVKADFASMTNSMSVSFSTQGSPTDNGNITFDEPGINVASNFSLPRDMVVFQDQYFTGKVNQGSLSDAAIIRGHFDYDVPSSQLKSLWFDIDAAFFGDLAVSFNLTAPLNNNNYEFNPGTFFPSTINVPNAFSLKPVLRWGIGVDVGTTGPLDHSCNMSLQIPDGHAHIDFMNSSRSHATGWSPRLASSVNTREAASGHASPYIDFSIELALDVMNGVFGVTGGVSARPQFINEFNLPQSHTRVRKAERMIWPRNVTCTNGFELQSAFNFSVKAYVTDWWQQDLYSTKIPIADECFPF